MMSRLSLIVLAELAVTAVLLALALLVPGGRPAPVVAAAGPAAPSPPAVSQARTPRPGPPSAKPAPAKVAAAKVAPAPPAPVAGPPATPVPKAPPADEPAAPPVAPAVTAAGLPDTGGNYRKARRQLLANGFKPARVAPPECRGPEPSVDACWGALVEFPEIEACQGKGGASCTGWWVAPDGRVLNIRTAGEHDKITDRHWATPGEIAELPKGWRP